MKPLPPTYVPGNTDAERLRPLEIPRDIAAKCDAPNQGERFDRMLRKVLTAPKTDLDRYQRMLKARRKKAK